MDLFEIVMKLAGPISATGDHGLDLERRENAYKLGDLVVELVGHIIENSEYSNDLRISIREVGKMNESVLEEIYDMIKEYKESK